MFETGLPRGQMGSLGIALAFPPARFWAAMDAPSQGFMEDAKVSSSLVLLLGFATSAFGADVQWKSDYREATKLAKSLNKPVLVYFKNAKAGPQTDAVEVDPRLLDPFVLVMADRSTDAGAKLFKMFEMAGDHGVVVVERDQNWQFCRYERKLQSNELAEVLKQTSQAQGKPATDKLASVPETASERTSYYPPAEGGNAPVDAAQHNMNWMLPAAGSCPNCRRY